MKLNQKIIRGGYYETPQCQVVGLMSESVFLTTSTSSTTGAEDYTVTDDSSNWN